MLQNPNIERNIWTITVPKVPQSHRNTDIFGKLSEINDRAEYEHLWEHVHGENNS